MEYSTIFGKFDWNKARRGKFQGKSGNFMSIARIIYNGLSYNFGTQDGAVTIMDGFMAWNFIAPVDRFDLSRYEDMTLREMLEDVIADVENVPVVAWDEFFEFLDSNEDMANAAVHGFSVHRIGGAKLDLPLIEGCSDFCKFMRWLCDNAGEAGNLPAKAFIHEQDMAIPIDLYTATPVSLTAKTPTRKPTETEISLLGDYACFTTLEGAFAQPVFLMVIEDVIVLYAYEETSDMLGGIVPQGWNVVSEDENGLIYTPWDIDANPVTIPFPYGEGIEVNWQAKIFMDIEYSEETEVQNGTITFLLRA